MYFNLCIIMLLIFLMNFLRIGMVMFFVIFIFGKEVKIIVCVILSIFEDKKSLIVLVRFIILFLFNLDNCKLLKFIGDLIFIFV